MKPRDPMTNESKPMGRVERAATILSGTLQTALLNEMVDNPKRYLVGTGAMDGTDEIEWASNEDTLEDCSTAIEVQECDTNYEFAVVDLDTGRTRSAVIVHRVSFE
jgi:hypothetical protein